MLHERLQGTALVAKKVVDFGEHETRKVASACRINGLAKQLVVRRASDMVAQHQFFRVRLQIELSRQVANVVDAHVVPDERQRNDERNEASLIVVDDLPELAL